MAMKGHSAMKYAVWYRASVTGHWFKLPGNGDIYECRKIAWAVEAALKQVGNTWAHAEVREEAPDPEALQEKVGQIRADLDAAMAVPHGLLDSQMGGVAGTHWITNAAVAAAASATMQPTLYFSSQDMARWPKQPPGGAFLTCRSCGGQIGGIGGGHAADCPGRKGTWPK
jgi:hypothetical protein